MQESNTPPLQYSNSPSPPSSVTVCAPSRLHFGMFSFGQPEVRQFGGVGLMVDRPGLQVRVSNAEFLSATGPLAEKARELVLRVATHLHIEPKFHVEILSTPRPHVGLGTGTQLGMSIAAAVYKLAGRDPPSPEELARACGRGRRSAIGVHGFCQGGLLVEAGKLAPDELSPSLARVELPSRWRFLLITPREDAGLHGPAEQSAFDRLPPIEPALTAKLQRIAMSELVPAAERDEFERFRDALQEFNALAGLCFAAEQGGVYSFQAQRVIDELKSLGIRGYAQTSWGPTVCVPLAGAAAQIEESCRQLDADVITAEANRGGARFSI